MEKKSWLDKRILTPLFLAALVVFILTYSRGAWIVFLLAVAVLGFFRYRKLLILAPVVVVLAVVLQPAVLERIYDILDPSYTKGTSGWESRLEFWSVAMPLVYAKPLFGHGLSMISIKLGNLAHNDYLRLLVEVGLVGLSAYVYLAWRLLRITWRDYHRSSSVVVRSFQIGLMAVLLAVFVRQSADNTIRNTVVMMYLWLFIALVRNIGAIRSSSSKDPV